MHERMSLGEKGVMGNMLRRGESSWLCMKFVLFADHSILIRVLPLCFLALTVNELCVLFLPKPHATSCFVLHIFLVRFPYEIFMLFLL
jgi:hypothetical protein